MYLIKEYWHSLLLRHKDSSVLSIGLFLRYTVIIVLRH